MKVRIGGHSGSPPRVAFVLVAAVGLLGALIPPIGAASGASTAVIVAVVVLVAAGGLFGMAFATHTTIAMEGSVIIIRKHGSLGSALEVAVSDIVEAKVAEGPTIRLELRSGEVVSVGPWEILLTQFDLRQQKCEAIAMAINAAAHSVTAVQSTDPQSNDS